MGGRLANLVTPLCGVTHLRLHFLWRRDSAWKRHRDKTRRIKQGMMRNLPTGRVRLVCVSSCRGAARKA
ncbi:hypothetical protein BMS3Bbin12_01565 [bacterium BMS3Bbin12]|nr:hypothetical protein BMS3Abin12_01208 [bacterium BMS3Abin12]GBE48387.1 hypothetical protein BMS3Bbin12_01565 [bacterium BMS3Bbin12]GBE50532.1 hypothetical protein BMS3Bbin13_01472 [bacterium BMS3Bbin13]